MTNDKRNISGYIEMHSIRFGGGELILAENPSDKKARYMVCDASSKNELGLEFYTNAIGSNDFLKIMKEFTKRLSKKTAALETERKQRGIPLQIVAAEDCHSIWDMDIEGCVVAIKPETLLAEYRSIDYQLQLCTGGFGAAPDSRGRKVFCTELISGEHATFYRENIAGFIPIELLPDWARINYEALKKPTEKESVLAKIQQDKQEKQAAGQKEQPDKPQKSKKNEPEH